MVPHHFKIITPVSTNIMRTTCSQQLCKSVLRTFTNGAVALDTFKAV